MKVRTKLWPDRELEVGDAEFLDLKRQGLLLEEEPKPEAPAVVVRKAPNKEDNK